MFQFTVELPEAEAQRIATAICVTHGYSPELGIDPVEFTRRVVMRWLIEQTLSCESNVAATQARAAVLENPDDPLAQALLTEG